MAGVSERRHVLVCKSPAGNLPRGPRLRHRCIQLARSHSCIEASWKKARVTTKICIDQVVGSASLHGNGRDRRKPSIATARRLREWTWVRHRASKDGDLQVSVKLILVSPVPAPARTEFAAHDRPGVWARRQNMRRRFGICARLLRCSPVCGDACGAASVVAHEGVSGHRPHTVCSVQPRLANSLARSGDSPLAKNSSS
jgi:hypothetical protein